MASLSDYSTTTAVDEPRSAFTSPVVAAHDELTKLTERLCELTDRMCGVDGKAEVAGVSPRPLSPVPSGVFAEVAERGLDMGVKLDRIRRCLNRIERALP